MLTDFALLGLLNSIKLQRFCTGFDNPDSCYVQNRLLHLGAHFCNAQPTAVVIQANPAAFLGAVEPILVLLVEHLHAGRFPDVEDLVTVRVSVVKVSGCALAHLAV